MTANYSQYGANETDLDCKPFDISSRYSDTESNTGTSVLSDAQSLSFRLFHQNTNSRIRICKDKFEPNHMVVQSGTCVEWCLEVDEKSSERKKTYVVSFDSIPEESDPLKNGSDTFKVTFMQPGVF